MSSVRELAGRTPRGPGRVWTAWHGPVCEVVIDHPRRRNALTPHMMVDLADLELGDARCLVLRGAEGTFCSGGDLSALRQELARPGMGAALATFMTAAVDRMIEAAPLVVALEGHALGGGAELVVAGDFVYAAPGAELGFVQAALGVSPGFGGGGRLVHRVGPARARALLVTAARVESQRAYQLGLVDEIHPYPVEEARVLAARVASMPAGAVRAARRVAGAWAEGDGRAAELEAFDELWGGPDHLAALGRR